jgi:apolipoprotein D and lipocalin family protein
MRKSLLALVACLAVALPAAARAPEPTKRLDLDRFMGRWYEIYRTPNNRQKNCFAAQQTWARKDQGGFTIRQSCRRGAPDGPERVVGTSAKVIDPATNAKFEASFFGGLIRQRYWVIDRAEDYSWMIASTEAGNFVSILARAPGLPQTQQAMLVGRAAALGFDTTRLQAVGAAVD